MEQWVTRYLLENSEPNYVFEWLKNNQPESGSYMFDDKERLSIETTLFDRNNPIINLGLALFGLYSEVSLKLYSKDDNTLKRAVLSGRSVGGFGYGKWWLKGILTELIKEPDTDLVKSLLANKYLPDFILCDLFECKPPFDSICEEDWMTLCLHTSKNDRLSTPYDNSWMDGYDEYKYERVFSTAWKLFDMFPKTPFAANVLEKLGSKLLPESHEKPKDILKIIESWNFGEEHKLEEYFQYTRTQLARLIPYYSKEFKSFRESHDIALRKAYYFSVRYTKPEEIKVDFEKDSNDFLDAALRNKFIYVREELREALRVACWDAPDKYSDMLQPNIFNAQVEYWQEQQPEWFADETTGEVPFEQIPEDNKRLETRVSRLNEQVNEIHKSLLGEENEENENDHSKQSTIDYFRAELEGIAQVLVKLHNDKSAVWGWALAGLAVGYTVSKF